MTPSPLTNDAADASNPMDAIKEKMRAAGMRVTAPTAAIARCVVFSKTALSHADVMNRLAQSHLDRVTVYRVLDRFARLGVFTKHSGSDGVARYGLAPPTQSAPGLFECLNCHSMTPLSATTPKAQALAKTLAKTLAQLAGQLSPSGATGVAAELTLRGTCQGCAAPA